MLSKNQLGFLYMFMSICAFSLMDVIVKWSVDYPIGQVLFFRGFFGIIFITPVLCSVLPASKIAWKPEIKSADLVIELNEKLKGYCTENNIAYVDYFSSMVGEKKELRADLTYDGVHPDKKGYLIMEKILLETIQKKF